MRDLHSDPMDVVEISVKHKLAQLETGKYYRKSEKLCRQKYFVTGCINENKNNELFLTSLHTVAICQYFHDLW